MKVLVSACLLGENCKYDGKNNLNENLQEFLEGKEIVTVCPEVMGGLTTPRKPAEIVKGIVKRQDGISVDAEYKKGALAALQVAKDEKIDLAILMSRSPSCGVNQIYDGTFSGTKIEGHGTFAEKLIAEGYKVIDIEDIDKLK